MRREAFAAAVIACAACSRPVKPGDYLFVWAGDPAEKASDFLAVVDANPASPRYGAILASLPTGTSGSHPHHTEAEMPADGHLLATFQYTADSSTFAPVHGGPAGSGAMRMDREPDTGGPVQMDERFRDPGSARPGVNLSARKWPHEFAGTANPHGTVFSR